MNADPASATVSVTVTVNDATVELTVSPDRFLIDMLRDDLGLTGTKLGCGIGVCGLCSVIVDGKLMSACLVPAVAVDGSTIETIEGITGTDGALSALQEAFIRYGGVQCGICTPGQVIAATALLRERNQLTSDEVREWMAGNLCRCTGYVGILAAVLAAASAEECS